MNMNCGSLFVNLSTVAQKVGLKQLEWHIKMTAASSLALVPKPYTCKSEELIALIKKKKVCIINILYIANFSSGLTSCKVMKMKEIKEY